jgi:hypothetical protein
MTCGFTAADVAVGSTYPYSPVFYSGEGDQTMSYLHYGPGATFELDELMTEKVMSAIAGKAAGTGNWASFLDVDGKQWSLFISRGIPIWIDATSEGNVQIHRSL